MNQLRLENTGRGELSPSGDRWQLRFVRELPYSQAKVWRAITEPEHQKAWFPDSMVGHRVPGAKLRFVGEGFEFGGEMLTFDPQSLMELTWGDDQLRFEVVGNEHASVLTLTHTFAERGKAARDGAGWHECLDRLDYALAEKDVPWTGAGHWKELNAGYQERLGPEASTIGPPEGK